MDQTHRVDHLERHGGGHGRVHRSAEHFAGGDAQDRSDALAPRHERVPHGFAYFVGLGDAGCHGGLEGGLDGGLF